MPIESSEYLIILFRVNKVFTFYHIIGRIWVSDKINLTAKTRGLQVQP